jgi:hypothetical protein
MMLPYQRIRLSDELILEIKVVALMTDVSLKWCSFIIKIQKLNLMLQGKMKVLMADNESWKGKYHSYF